MGKIKIMAFYLPQFHTIPENDEWWGKGFTEWVNVRKARPLFKGHNQPRVPLNENYYDLSKVETLRWQADLANTYGVYGLCFYHYWFAGGKKLLEKPAEMLLENKDIRLRFCFSWANEPWARTWDGKAHHVLMAQDYGMEDDWKKHFYYLLPFFKDDRYVKEDGCPMFLIYKPHSIPHAKEMMEMWNGMAIKEGFNGIHFVETLRGTNRDNRNLPFKAYVEFEPALTNYSHSFLTLNYNRIRRRLLKAINKVFGSNIMLNRPYQFEEVMRRSLKHKSPQGTYGGVCVGWDNTARRGNASVVVLPSTKNQFKKALKDKIIKTEREYNADYVFINAWNEWCEGTYLEPDEVHKYDYLEAICELHKEGY